MARWIRFGVILFVLLGMLGVGTFFVLRELEKIADEKEPPVFINPAYDIAIGDWTEYRRENDMIERQEVVAVDALTYTLKIESTSPAGEKVLMSPQRRAKLACGLGDRFVPVSYRPERIEVAGREWDAWRIELLSPLVGRAVGWVSAEVPLGLLRRKLTLKSAETGGQLNYEYIRHGRAKE